MSERKPGEILRDLEGPPREDEGPPFAVVSDEEIDRELRAAGVALDEARAAARGTAARAVQTQQDPPEEEPPSTGKAWVTVHPPPASGAPSRTRSAAALSVASLAAVLAALIAAALLGGAMYAALWRNQHDRAFTPRILLDASSP